MRWTGSFKSQSRDYQKRKKDSVNSFENAKKHFMKTNHTTQLDAKITIQTEMLEDERCIQPIDKSKGIPVYWINLEKSKNRRAYYADQLDKMGYKNRRIEAVTKTDGVVMNSTLKVRPRIRQTPGELSCVISHLLAIYTAIHDESYKHIPYALITEDDVHFEMDVDLLTLAENAPSGFGALQLMTSSSNYVNSLWNTYHDRVTALNNENNTNMDFPHNLIWSPRRYDAPYWSAQAYLISKEVVRTFIDNAVTYDESTSTYAIKIINPSETDLPCPRKTDCHVPYRIVSDTYIFHGCQPTYTSSIPMFNGASVGQNTTIHATKNNDNSHAKSFIEIAGVLKRVRKNADLLPSYIRQKSNCTRTENRKLRFRRRLEKHERVHERVVIGLNTDLLEEGMEAL